MIDLVPIALGNRQHGRAGREFSLTETRYGAGQRLPSHAHEHPVLSFILAGQVREDCVSQHSAVCRQSSLVVIPAGTPHGETFPAPGARCLIIEMKGPRARFVHDSSRLFERPACLTGACVAALGRQLHDEFRHADDLSALAIEGIILQLTAAASRLSIARRPGTPPAWLLRIRDLMHSRFRQAITLADLALEADVHPVHLARAFGQWFGCSPAAYLRRLRIDAACEALIKSERSLSEIAVASGFSDHSHMDRQFRRRLGLTPGAFRRANGRAR